MAAQLNEDVPKGTIAKFIYENMNWPKKFGSLTRNDYLCTR